MMPHDGLEQHLQGQAGMKLMRLLGLALALGPSVGLFGCYTTREQRYQDARAAARRHLDRRLYECGYNEPCRARARADYDMRMAEIERYRM
jgi:hypothetical protein